MGNDQGPDFEGYLTHSTDWDFELNMEMLAFRLRDVVQLKPTFQVVINL